MRNLFLGCLVLSGLMSAAPAFAAKVGDVVPDGFVVGFGGVYTCQNACVIVAVNEWGEVTRVKDSQGGWVNPPQRQYTNEPQ